MNHKHRKRSRSMYRNREHLINKEIKIRQIRLNRSQRDRLEKFSEKLRKQKSVLAMELLLKSMRERGLKV